MKRILLISVFSILLLANTIGATFELSDLLNPDSILIGNDRIYVTEGVSIYIYSKDDLKLINKFGKKGEGPGEINTSRRGGVSLNLSETKGKLFIQNRSKVLFFTKDGKFLSEKKLNGGFIREMIPLSDYFVARSFKFSENRTRSESVTIFSSNFTKIGEINGKTSELSRGSFFKIYYDNNIFKMRAFDNKLYLNDSKAFLIKVFNKKGKRINSISIKYSLLNIGSKTKEEIKNYYKNESRFSSFWERIKTMFDISETYPAIKNFFVTGNLIYVQTYKHSEKGYEFYILDKTGKPIRKKNIQIIRKNIMEDYPYFISGQKIYSLVEDEDEEEWKLIVQNI